MLVRVNCSLRQNKYVFFFFGLIPQLKNLGSGANSYGINVFHKSGYKLRKKEILKNLSPPHPKGSDLISGHHAKFLVLEIDEAVLSGHPPTRSTQRTKRLHLLADIICDVLI